jgi:hypothetical protein
MMKTKYFNPHDKFFKQSFSHLDLAAEFMHWYLPPDVAAALDLSRLRLEKDSFVDPKLREHFSDLLFEVGLVGGGSVFICLLLEHKSKPEKWVALQLLRSMTPVWQARHERGLKRLPLIIPVVIYHGAKPWKVDEHFSALLELESLPEALRQYALDFKYYLCDLSKFEDLEVIGQAGLPAVLQLMKHIFMSNLKSQLPQVFDTVVDQVLPTRVAEQLNIMVRYIHETGRVTDEELLAALGQSKKGGKYMDSIWVELIPAKLRLVEQQTRATVALDQLKQKLGTISETAEARIRELSFAELQQLSGDLLDFNSRSDLTAWLRRHAPKKKSTKAATH